jgi:putative ABC transport system permease protein
VVGALRTQLVIQYLSESIIIALLAFVCAVGIALSALPWLNAFTNKQLALALPDDWSLTAALFFSALAIGTIAGIYPAFIISSFRPATILKGQQGLTRAKAGLRKVLVVSQFAISIILIIATLVTFRQLQYMNTQSLGYNRDQVVAVRYYRELDGSYDAFYNELLRGTAVQNVSRSSRIPTDRLLDSRGTAQVQQGDSLTNTNVVLKNIAVDQEFFDTYGIPFVAGRNFSKAIKTDDSLSFVLNEAAVRMIGVTPDEILKKDFQYFGVRGRVIGVVRDFHFESLREPIVPMVFHIGGYGNISVKIAGNRMHDALADMEKIWKQFLPHRPFEYNFLSMQYAQLYDAEKKQGQLFIVFSGLAIFIASLGLFGLATFNTLQRIREIGIRKVLGASVGNIVRLLSREIMILIVVANFIAWPVAWYFTNEWLNTFAYRIENSFLLYVSAGMTAVAIALITVGSQTIRAALSNPADTLRSE